MPGLCCFLYATHVVHIHRSTVYTDDTESRAHMISAATISKEGLGLYQKQHFSYGFWHQCSIMPVAVTVSTILAMASCCFDSPSAP